MSIPSQGGLFAFAPQNGKIGKGVFNSAAHSWRRMLATGVGFGAKQNQQVFPPEVGGAIVPKGAYKTGVFGAGGVEFIPRAEEVLGYLLQAAVGTRVSTPDSLWHPTLGTDDEGGTVEGINTHVFSFDLANSYFLPWFAVRTMAPGLTQADIYGEETYDCKVAGLTLTIPAAGLLQASIEMLGRCPTFPESGDVAGWTYVNSLEDSLSAPVSGNGHFLIAGEELPITQATFELANNLTSPQQEQIVGSYYMDDIVALSRQASIRIVYKWENPQLYRKLMTGQGEGATEWNSIPLLHSTNGSAKAFEAYFASGGTIPGSVPTTPYSLRIVANRVVWSLDRNGVTLEPGNIISVPFIGTILEPAEGQSYLDMILQNGVTYTWSGPNIAPALHLPLVQSYFGVPVQISPAGALEDSDSINLNTGTLTVLLAGTDYDDTNDEITIVPTGLIGLAVANVQYDGVTIGTFVGDGKTATPLVVTFNTEATPGRVSALLRALFYDRTGGEDDGEQLTATVTLTDGDGGSDSGVITIDHITE